MKKLFQVLVIVTIMLCVVPINAFAADDVSIPVASKGCSVLNDVDSEEHPVIDKVYNEYGEVIEFTILLGENNHEIYQGLISERSSRASLKAISEFADGVCFMIEVVFNVTCAKIAREIGLQFLNGYYMMGNQKYSGKWEVTYGYIDGCEPRHSGTYFKATYKKIG